MPNLSTSAPATPTSVTPDRPAGPAPSVASNGHARQGERSSWRPYDNAGHRNEVVLAGRVTAEPAVRELPSGTHLTTWRISVTRPPADQRPNRPVDPITCVSFRPSIEEATRGWRIGDLIQVSGALRRRFWRSPNGSNSVVEVEVCDAHRITPAESSVSADVPAPREPGHHPR